MSLLAAINRRRRQAGECRVCGSKAEAPKGGHISRALKQTTGFTLTEALATVIIVGLVTAILASSVALGTRQYTQSMANSEAQMLYSSLQKILDTELRFTQTITVDSTSGQVVAFESKHYKGKQTGDDPENIEGTSLLCTFEVDAKGGVTGVSTPDVPGQLGMASKIESDAVCNPFLGSGAYNYGLQASIPYITYNESGGYFRVELVISRGSGDDASTLVDEYFTVKGLNLRAVDSGSGGNGSSGSGTGGGTGEGGAGEGTGGSGAGSGAGWHEPGPDESSAKNATFVPDTENIARGDSVTFFVPTELEIPPGTILKLLLVTSPNGKGSVKYVQNIELTAGASITVDIDIEPQKNGSMAMLIEGSSEQVKILSKLVVTVVQP